MPDNCSSSPVRQVRKGVSAFEADKNCGWYLARCRGLQGTKASFAAVNSCIALGGTRAIEGQIKKKVRKKKHPSQLNGVGREPLAI